MKSKAIHLIADIVVQTVLANGAGNVAGVLTAPTLQPKPVLRGRSVSLGSLVSSYAEFGDHRNNTTPSI